MSTEAERRTFSTREWRSTPLWGRFPNGGVTDREVAAALPEPVGGADHVRAFAFEPWTGGPFEVLLVEGLGWSWVECLGSEWRRLARVEPSPDVTSHRGALSAFRDTEAGAHVARVAGVNGGKGALERIAERRPGENPSVHRYESRVSVEGFRLDDDDVGDLRRDLYREAVATGAAERAADVVSGDAEVPAPYERATVLDWEVETGSVDGPASVVPPRGSVRLSVPEFENELVVEPVGSATVSVGGSVPTGEAMLDASAAPTFVSVEGDLGDVRDTVRSLCGEDPFDDEVANYTPPEPSVDKLFDD